MLYVTLEIQTTLVLGGLNFRTLGRKLETELKENCAKRPKSAIFHNLHKGLICFIVNGKVFLVLFANCKEYNNSHAKANFTLRRFSWQLKVFVKA
jgi:hypothetical protein